jgi:hypothetical protein
MSPGQLKTGEVAKTTGKSAEETARSYFAALSHSALNIFCYSTIEDAFGLRKSHAALISDLAALISHAHVDRFRLFLRLVPQNAGALVSLLRGDGTWLQRELSPSITSGIVTLGEIGVHDLEEWAGLMAMIVEKPEIDIEDAVSDVFAAIKAQRGLGGTLLPFAAFETELKSFVAQWPMRAGPRRALAAQSPARWHHD